MAVSVLAGLASFVIGESHLAYPHFLTNPLVDDLTQQGAKVHALGGCAAGPDSWVKATHVSCAGERYSNKPGTHTMRDATTIPVKDLMATDKPDLLIVVIGDAPAAYEKPDFPMAWSWQTVTSLTKVVAASKTTCVWVGPIWGEDGGKFYKNNKRMLIAAKFLAANVAPCIYIDSLQFAKQGEWRTIDGEHLNDVGYKAWAAAITKAVISLPQVQKLKKP